ncbi:AraC family transcriptional regulator [Cohnella fermenti]|uniref:AraC family transcriptional regulator n=1 Tax=Cohnella fermenti TaxID=2565925 RepID=UPI001454DB71|nr:AraC family transcriptional regulator [Cohnella fermenti]
MSIEAFSFGNMNNLYAEYVKRSETYIMTVDHFHPYYEVYYLLSGSRVYFVKDRTYRVEQGDLVFIDKSVVHKTLQGRAPEHERVVIHFTDAYLHGLAGDNVPLLLEPFRQAGPVIRLPRSDQRSVDAIIRRLLGEIRLKPPGYELVPPAAVTELLLATARSLRENAHLGLDADVSPKHAKIFEIVRHLNEHYDEQIRLGDIASRFFVSPYHLSRTFREVTGFAFSDYIQLTRVKEAQRLLTETDRPIAEIAAVCGFDNFSHFGKTFKKITRQSPRDYRKGAGF